MESMGSNGLDGVHEVPKRWARGVQGVPASEFRTFWVKKGCCVGKKGVPEGVPFRCLGRFRGIRESVVLSAIGLFIEEIWGPRGVPKGWF